MGGAEWRRGSCDRGTTQFSRQSVVCNCSSWKMFLAVTQTRNSTDVLLGKLLAGPAQPGALVSLNNWLNVGAMVPLALCFLAVCAATTRTKPFMQCRLEVLFCLVGTHLLSLLSYWMHPANISCVYIMYIYELFALATVLWFCAEFICLQRYIKAKFMDDKDMQPRKMFSFKCAPVVYMTAFLIPSIFIAVFKITDGDVSAFVEPFDAQSCWFNRDREFVLFLAPMYSCLFLSLLPLAHLVITCVSKKSGFGGEVLGSCIMFFTVAVSWVLLYFRGVSDYIEFTAKSLQAAQGLVALVCYLALATEVKMSLFSGCFPKDDEEKEKLVGHG